MSSESLNVLAGEWTTLQNNVQLSEAIALAIKLVGVVVCLVCIIYTLNPLISILLLLVLWLQEAIWKTFQARTELRLLKIEHAWSAGDAQSALQLHSDWAESRPGAGRLIVEYLCQAVRPTVAFPYAILLLITLITL